MRLLALVFALLLWVPLRAEPVAVPPLRQRVTDLTGTLSAQQQQRLEARLQAFEARKGAQLAVLVVPTTGSETIEQYGLRVAESWKLGRKGIDDGALLLVAKQDRSLRIEVGYGLEGILPDAIAKRIISDVMVPKLRQGDFGGAIEAGLEQMMRVIDGEPLPAPKAERRNPLGSWLPALLFLFLILGGVLRALFGRLIGASLGGLGVGVLVFLITGFLLGSLIFGFFFFLYILTAGLGSRGASVGSRGFRGLGGGGGFGGGFSGGGGSFGGGGASGRW